MAELSLFYFLPALVQFLVFVGRQFLYQYTAILWFVDGPWTDELLLVFQARNDPTVAAGQSLEIDILSITPMFYPRRGHAKPHQQCAPYEVCNPGIQKNVNITQTKE